MLNSGLKSADADGLITEIQAFENPNAYIENTLYPSGELKGSTIVLVEFNDGRCYITSRGERASDPFPEPMMFTYIVERAGSVSQLKRELDGYNLGLGYRKATDVTVYQDGEAAAAGDDSGERIIQNGELVGSDDMFDKSKICRVDYGEGANGIFVPDLR